MLAALPHIAETMDADGVRLDFLGADKAMAGQVETPGLEPVDRGFDGTVKAIEPPGLAPALRHLVGPGTPIEAGADGFLFRLGCESFAVRGLEEVTAFLFGSIERRAMMPGPGPLALEAGSRVRDPLPDYGVNYLLEDCTPRLDRTHRSPNARSIQRPDHAPFQKLMPSEGIAVKNAASADSVGYAAS